VDVSTARLTLRIVPSPANITIGSFACSKRSRQRASLWLSVAIASSWRWLACRATRIADTMRARRTSAVRAVSAT